MNPNTPIHTHPNIFSPYAYTQTATRFQMWLWASTSLPPQWPNGQGTGLLSRGLWVRVPSGVTWCSFLPTSPRGVWRSLWLIWSWLWLTWTGIDLRWPDLLVWWFEDLMISEGFWTFYERFVRHDELWKVRLGSLDGLKKSSQPTSPPSYSNHEHGQTRRIQLFTSVFFEVPL